MAWFSPPARATTRSVCHRRFKSCNLLIGDPEAGLPACCSLDAPQPRRPALVRFWIKPDEQCHGRYSGPGANLQDRFVSTILGTPIAATLRLLRPRAPVKRQQNATQRSSGIELKERAGKPAFAFASRTARINSPRSTTPQPGFCNSSPFVEGGGEACPINGVIPNTHVGDRRGIKPQQPDSCPSSALSPSLPLPCRSRCSTGTPRPEFPGAIMIDGHDLSGLAPRLDDRDSDSVSAGHCRDRGVRGRCDDRGAGGGQRS